MGTEQRKSKGLWRGKEGERRQGTEEKEEEEREGVILALLNSRLTPVKCYR